MTSYNVPFARPNMTHGAKERQALAEVMEWLTPKQRQALDAMAVSIDTPKEMVQCARCVCGMTGMRGYWICRAVARYMLQKRFPGRFEMRN